METQPARAPITSCMAKATPAVTNPSTSPSRPANGRQMAATMITATSTTTYRTSFRAT